MLNPLSLCSIHYRYAQSTIAMLEAKVNASASLIQATRTQVLTHTSEITQERSSLTVLTMKQLKVNDEVHELNEKVICLWRRKD
jgi:uncharacterized coiled-coil protein SlyX